MKKILSSVLAAAMVASVASISVFAAKPDADRKAATVAFPAIDDGNIVNEDNEALKDKGVSVKTGAGSIVLDNVRPSSTFYIKLEDVATAIDVNFGGADTDAKIDSDDLMDKKLFTFKADKETGSKLVKSVSLESEKVINGSARANWVKVVLNDDLSTSEKKAEVELTFKARKDTTDETGNNGYSSNTTKVKAGDILTLDLTMWISNEKVGNDSNPDVGARVVIEPEKNETNTIVWGDDRAALTFDSHDDAGKFYARLNTKNDAAIWREYADPVDADLWFYEFVGSSTIPATSRATLTLGIPWDDDDDYAIDPEDAYIYEKDADGRLIDVTSKFTYSEDDAEIPGWSIKTRTLGTYIVSDTELDLDIEDEDEDVSEAEETGKTTTGAKPIPDTGASDMVNVAVVAGIVSLAAAGAVAFRKAK